jgi:toxin YoeB
MKLVFSDAAWSDYLYWQQTDPDMLQRVNELIRDCLRSPFKGIGKPEPLRGDLKGWWSRRITLEHRLIYRVNGIGEAQSLEIAACRFHYSR